MIKIKVTVRDLKNLYKKKFTVTGPKKTALVKAAFPSGKSSWSVDYDVGGDIAALFHEAWYLGDDFGEEIKITVDARYTAHCRIYLGPGEPFRGPVVKLNVVARNTSDPDATKITLTGPNKTALSKLAFPKSPVRTTWSLWPEDVGRWVDELVIAIETLSIALDRIVELKVDMQYSFGRSLGD